MKGSQSDVDRVMAAFGAAPIRYRPDQEVAAPAGAPTSTPGVFRPSIEREAVAAPAARAADRILPGSGGRLREVFPLLARAIPGVADLKIVAVKRAGDEMPAAAERPEAEVAPARLPASPPPAAAPAPEPVREPVHEPATVVVPAAAQAVVAPAQAAPAPLRSHADLIRARAPRRAEPEAPPGSPLQMPSGTPQPAAAIRPATLWPPAAPPALAATPTPAPAPITQPGPVAAPPIPPQQAYPPFFSPQGMPPQAMPPPGMPPYPMHPASLAWAQQGYPPPYPMPPPGYPPGYAPAHSLSYPPGYAPGYPPGYSPGYPAPYPYGFSQQPLPDMGEDALSASVPEPAATPQPPPPPQAESAAHPPAQPAPAGQPSLSAIFAALHRAPRPSGEETS
ncbi:MAG: hypothetical protein HIU92_01660 [Proteobacteria bacterium]|nr:hypothetical protein [Pseudomonadota bacterium]